MLTWLRQRDAKLRCGVVGCYLDDRKRAANVSAIRDNSAASNGLLIRRLQSGRA